MKKDIIFIGVDLGVAPTDYKCICVMKQHKDGTTEVVDTFSTQDSILFEEKKKELETKYSAAVSIQETNKSSFTPIKKSRKTKDTKSFNSKNYEIFKNGFFNCDNIPYGYNFLLGRCMEPATFEPKRKEK